MSLFHHHAFLQSDVSEVLYCICGEVKSLHQHKWQKLSELVQDPKSPSAKTVGYVLKCEICGDLKNHSIWD